MKYVKTCLIYGILCLGIPGSVLAQEGLLDLYIGPDIYSTKVESVEAGDTRLGDPAPVMDEAKAALGWQYADFQGSVVGYVPDAKIGKDLLPVDDCLIRAEPSENAAVLCVYRFGDPIEIIDTGLWWEVRVETSFPVYFLAGEPAPLPPVTGEAEPLPLVESEPAMEMAEEPALAVEDSTALVPPVPAVKQETAPPRPGVVGLSYEGIFRKAKRRFGLLKPKAKYYLEGPDGKRLAWINLDNAVITGSINEFFDKAVVVHGERVQIEDSRQWMIYARNVRNR